MDNKPSRPRSEGDIPDSVERCETKVELCDHDKTGKEAVTYTCKHNNGLGETHRQDSDSGRCTPQDVEIFRHGSPAVRFEEILIDVINSTTIHVDWCPVNNNTDLIGYKIRYAIKDNPSYNEVFVTAGISNFTISELKPNTEYVVAVCAIDEKENVIHQCGWATQRTDDLGEHRPKPFEAPYVTAVAAILLLLVAVVVPVSLLFASTCGQCETPRDQPNASRDKTNISPNSAIPDSIHIKDLKEQFPQNIHHKRHTVTTGNINKKVRIQLSQRSRLSNVLLRHHKQQLCHEQNC